MTAGLLAASLMCVLVVQAPDPSAPRSAALGRTQESAVRARALAWWKARERRDHQRMYALFDPAYRRQVSFSEFLKENAIRTRFELADPKVESVQREGPRRVRVKVSIEAHLPRLPITTIAAEDVWIYSAGTWFKVHEEIPLPFPVSRQSAIPAKEGATR